MPYYLAPYVGSGTRQDPRRPRGADDHAQWAAIDLRPDPTVAAGYALVWTPGPASGAGVAKLCDSAEETLPLSVRSALGSALGVTVEASAFGEAILDLMLRPPVRGWGRLWATRDRYLVHLGPLRAERPLSVALSDDFNRADEDPLASPWTHVSGSTLALSSNAITKPSGDNETRYYYASAASTSDQYSEIKLITSPPSNDFGPAVRISTGSDMYVNTVVDFGYALRKLVSGSWTILTFYDSGGFLTSGETCAIRAVGSTLTAIVRTEEKATATDTSLTGGQPGLFWYRAGGSLDDWSGGDVTPPVISVNYVRRSAVRL